MKPTRIFASIAAAIVAAAAAASPVKCGADFTLYNVMPFSPGREAQSAADCREYLERTGCDLALYSLTLHPEGKPAMEKVERYVASFRALKRELAGSGVRLGVLVQAIIGHWPRVDKDIEDWTRTVNIKGEKVRFCPDDPGFAKYIDDTFALLAKEKPAFVLTDDDVRAYSHDAECFCARHVAEFNKRRGTNYSEKELREKVAAASHDDPDYKTFFAVQRDMMNRLAKRFRAAIDSVDPSIPAGICVAGEEMFLVPPMARAIAAKGQKPVMRVATGCYMERYASNLPGNVMRLLGFAEYYRNSGIDILDEADTCPHNLWSKSALSFFTHLEVASFLGYKGAKTWFVNGHKGAIPVSRAYTDVLAENRGLLDALSRDADAAEEARGVAVPCFSRFPKWHVASNHREMFIDPGTFAERVFIPFGIPFRAEKDFTRDGVYVVSTGAEVDRFTDEELAQVFSHKVLVTGSAALALTKRGRQDLIGLTAEMKDFRFNRERDVATGAPLTATPSDRMPFFSNLAPGAEVLTKLGFSPYAGSPVFEEAAPGTVLWRNPLGGTVATCAYHADMYPLHRFLDGRKAYLVGLIDRLAGKPAPFVCGNAQDVLVLARSGGDGATRVLAVNLNSEPMKALRFRVPDAATASVLAPDGSWRPLKFSRDGEWLVLDHKLAFYEAAVLKFGPPSVVLANDAVAAGFDGAGRLVSMREKATGRELVARPVPFAAFAPKGGREIAATEMARRSDGRLAFKFGDAGEAVFSVEPFDGGWTFKVESVTPADGGDLVFGRVRPVCAKYVGTFANAMSDNESFVALRGYESAVAMSCSLAAGLAVSVESGHGLVGRRAGLAAGPRSAAIPALRAMTLAAGVPHTELGGAWSLGAEGNRRSYYFHYHSNTNVEEVADLARRMGIGTINFYTWWDLLGRYDISKKNYAGGFDQFKASVDRLHELGFTVSLHSLTACIDLADPWISPKPSPHLVADARYTLAAPLAADADEIVVAEKPIAKHDLVYTYAGNGNILKIGDELIQYSAIRREPPYAFSGLTRGAFGTQAAAHPAKARCDYLHQRYLALYPVPDSPLAEELSDSLAGKFNAAGADQIYFDGAEGMGTRYGDAAMRRLIFSKLDQSKHPVLVEASNTGANNWWFHSRLGAWDVHVWAPKQFHDQHHKCTTDQARKAEFLEPQMGWWCPRGPSEFSRGDYLDEDEYFASRNVGSDCAMAINGIENLPGRGAASGQLRLATVIGWYESARRARAFEPSVKARMAVPGAEFRLRQDRDGVWRVRDAFVKSHRAAGEASAKWTEEFPAAMPAALRVGALYGVAAWDSPNATTAVSADDVPKFAKRTASGVTLEVARADDTEKGAAVSLAVSNATLSPRGAWAGAELKYEFPYRDLGKSHAAFGMWVKGDGSGALLNFQLTGAREWHGGISDHYVKIDFKGWRYVTFLLRERDSAQYRDHVWPYGHIERWGVHYLAIYRNKINMEHVAGVALWLNEIPADGKTSVLVSEVRALDTVGMVVDRPVVSVNGKAFEVPFQLASGDYAELEDGVWTRYDSFGEPLARGAAAMPEVVAGRNEFGFSSATEGARAEITVAALGAKAPAFMPVLTDEMKDVMAWEYEMPVRCAPEAGFAGEGEIAIRPGEKARVVAKTRGDAKGAALVLKQGEREVRVALPGESAEPLEGAWQWRVDGAAAADFRLEIAKRYK